MPLRVTTITLFLKFAMCIQCIKDIERVRVSELVIDGDVPISNDEDIPATYVIGNGSRSHAFKGSLTLCCIFGNCSCPSLYTVLANLTSNTLINITTDVTLSSVVLVATLANITIIGHNSPTVHCNNSGGLHFISCHNCTIRGITWDRCGTRENANFFQPVLQLSNCSEMIIEICSFQHSIGQAIVLSQMTGDVNISYCNFSSNNQYEGHGSAIHYSSHGRPKSSLTFMIGSSNFMHNEGAKSVVYFDRLSMSAKSCEYLYLQNSNFYYNKEVPIYLSNQNLYISGNIEFNGNVAENGGGIYISDHSNVTVHKSATVKFTHNRANINGGAIFLTNHSSITFKEHNILQPRYYEKLYYTVGDHHFTRSLIAVTFHNNTANEFGGELYVHNSRIIFGHSAEVNFKGNCKHSHLLCDDISGRSIVHISNQSIMVFGGNSSATFSWYTINGDLMYTTDSSMIIFEGDSIVNFFKNGADGNGGVMYINHHSTITFEGNSTVNFRNNSAYGNGGVMYVDVSSTITFEGSSTVHFISNFAYGNGGVMYTDGTSRSTVTFEGNSTVNFYCNYAYGNGGVMYIDGTYRSTVTIDGNSTVNFTGNHAHGNGGVMYTDNFSFITFKANSNVNFSKNYAHGNGGVVYIDHYSTITFEGNSFVNFFNNNGGVMYIDDSSAITFDRNCTVNFLNNIADNNGGVMYIDDSSAITFDGHCTVNFLNNIADNNGGVMYIDDSSTIIFKGNSAVNFSNNGAKGNGGVMYTDHRSIITFKVNTTVNFFNNTADSNGGVMYIVHSCTITFDGNSAVNFIDNDGDDNGGVIYIKDYSKIIFQRNSNASFHHNHANGNGGVMYIDQNCNLKLKERARVVLNSNEAYLGGGVYMKSSSFIIYGNSYMKFIDNTALRDGGAIYLRDQLYFKQLEFSSVTFYNNSASDYGGAIYVLYNKRTSIYFNNHTAYFKGNNAGTTQSSVYINVDKSCDKNCFLNSIANTNDIPVTTSPDKLVLYNPTKCINGNETDCDTYYMNNIMLGQDIKFNACLLDYYGLQTEVAQFSITGMNHQDYNISNSKYISIPCNRTITQGITITGNLKSNKTYNYSINISLHVTRFSESKVVSVKLIVELSQCHPGFWYSPANKSRKCECYNTGDIISCSGSNSTIKRGYWYGSVTGIPTVTTCPNDYCNFTCCEITNGIYHLSPLRANQCRPHRSGTACGSCEEGYTLSFDSPKCVEVNRCLFGLILVITLSLLYWIAVVTAVFAMMYFKVSIGSLYAIAYYYSVVDILLGRVLFISNGLYTTVTIMSSLAKLTPQFLGQLCLVKNMSGIDQQFIHYVHPVVVFLILVMVSRLARRSRKVSSFVSKGVIPFICFLLLLSYTSVASTSLLLMRPLKFADIDKVYTYLSPDIEYFHGHHLAYGIVALIFTITIVIGFPLLLLLEPFLNSKINFVKIKPLLDQFQGCYKDKYRYFAGYYMICRLVIILLVIVKISDDFTTQYLLISSCALTQLIHLLVRPYASTIHNIFDGIILQLIVIISVLPVIEFVDQYDKIFITVIIYVLVILPLISFIAIKARNHLISKKVNIIQIASYKCITIFSTCYYNKIATDDPQEPVEIREFSVIVDENIRRNAMISVDV